MILRSNKNIVAAFIRGLFDTDGGIYLEDKNNRLYPRIKISNNSEEMMSEIKNLLSNRFLFNLGFWKDKNTYVLTIRGGEKFYKVDEHYRI